MIIQKNRLPAEISFLYNGQYGVTSDDNGLYYMRARYYNVDIKRFINQDVVIGNIDSSASLNRYAYVEGNPVSYLNPFGLEPYDTDLLHLIANIVSLSLQAAALGFLITGHGVIASVLNKLSNATAVFNIAIDVADYLHAETTAEKNVKCHKLSVDVAMLLFNSLLSFYGKYPGMDVACNEISQRVMEVTTSVISYIINSLATALG